MACSKSVNEPHSLNIPRKTACSQLKEIHPGIQYELINAAGPPHRPVFDVSVTVNGETFTGRGGSKKMAKEAAAESVLSVVDRWLQVDDQNRFIIRNKPSINAEQEKPTLPILEPKDEKNPVMKLNEMFPNVEYKISEILGPSHRRHFTVQILFDGKVYEGSGQKIKLAKAAAAEAVLEDIAYKYEYYLRFPQLFSEKIERMVQDCLSATLTKYPGIRRTGVLAGIAMFKAEDLSTVQIIALAYGGECMESEKDCHITVLIRRCFLLYLYFQIELHLDGKESESIFEKGRDSSSKFHLKDGIQFYLYISATPCDESRISIMTNIKVEPGTSESNLEVRKTDGDSCQTRLSHWNFMGIQGSMLGHILEYISFSEIIYGGSLRSKYKLKLVCDNQQIERHSFGNCLMSQAHEEFVNSSAIWSQEMSDVEFVMCVNTGSAFALRESSQIAHKNLFQRFLRILKCIKDDVATTECFYPKMYDTDYKLVRSVNFQ